jgi:hypothetical protein
VHLTRQAEDPAAGAAAYAAFIDDRAVGSMVVRTGPDDALVVTVDWLLLADRAQAADLLATFVELAGHAGTSSVVVDTVDELTRLVARASGYSGGLREPLRRALNGPDATTEPPRPLPDTRPLLPDTRSLLRDSGRLLRDVSAFVPELAVETRTKGWARLVGSPPKLIDVVASHPALRRPVTLRMPNRPDAIPEAIAEILDTAIGVLRRFPVEIHRISCETASYDLANGRHAGETFPNIGMVYLSSSYLLADDFERTQRAWIEHNPGLRRRSLAPPPYSSIDGITAHELWHRIEDAYHHADWIAIHRALGAELGVETLEHALRGGSPGAPAAWQHAYRRVVDEVSRYATTNPREAKAEMFMFWWCRSGPPSPLVARFGEVIEPALLVDGLT